MSQGSLSRRGREVWVDDEETGEADGEDEEDEEDSEQVVDELAWESGTGLTFVSAFGLARAAVPPVMRRRASGHVGVGRRMGMDSFPG
jgi:hypothetical protein